MNLPPTPPLIRSPTRQPWLWMGLAVLLFPLVALGLVGLGVASYFHLSSDTRALQNGLIKASGVEWRQHLGLRVGGLTLGVARAGLSFVPLDPEARLAAQAVRGVEVSIYELGSETKRPDCAAMLAAADTVLSDRGWERLVGVLKDENLVTVYVPRQGVSARTLKCCVLVFDGSQMVVVSARADVEPLLKCLQNQSDLSAKVRSLAAW